MRRPPYAITSAALLSALALAGCGSQSTTPTTTVEVFPTIQFSSPAIKGAGPSPLVPARYTCDGQDVSPPFAWSSVPAGTRELVIFLVKLPVGAGAGVPFVPEWAIAGINPELHRLPAGFLPAGAHVGKDAKGRKRYSLCPPKGKVANYEFAVYALRPSAKPRANFSDNALLREIASGPSATSATAGGALQVTYKRK